MHDQVCLAINAGSDKPKKVPTEFTPSHQSKVKLSRMIKLSRENFAIEVNRSIAQATTEMNGISTSTNNRNILQLSASKKIHISYLSGKSSLAINNICSHYFVVSGENILILSKNEPKKGVILSVPITQ